MKDSLCKENNVNEMAEIQTKYEKEKKEKEIELQKLELGKKDAEVKQQTIQRNAFIVGFVLVLILVIVVLRGNK